MDRWGTGPLGEAITNSFTTIVSLLVDKGARIESKQMQKMMREASKEGDCEMIRNLFLAKMPLDISDEDGRTPLHLAARYAQADLVEWLCAHGAPIAHKDRWGKTALSLAKQYEHHNIVQMLTHILERS